MSDREGYLKRRDQLLMQDEEIAELKAELADTVTECLAAKSNEDIMRKQLAELREAAVLTDENNVRTAKMLLMFTQPDVDNYLLTGMVVNMALPGLIALQEKGE